MCAPYDPAFLPSPEPYPHRDFAPGLVEMLALDLPQTVTVFDHGAAAAAGAGGEPAPRASRSCARSPSRRSRRFRATAAAAPRSCSGDSVHTGSRALLMPGLAVDVAHRAVGDHGWLLSVPHRHQVVCHTVSDMSVMGVLNGMARFTVMGHEDATGSLILHVLVERLGVRAADPGR